MLVALRVLLQVLPKGLLSEWRACFKSCFWSGHAGERMPVEGAA